MGSQPKDRRDEEAGRAAESGDEETHPHVQAATELSDRAAKSVSERYDGTKEAYLHDPDQVESDEEGHRG
ncbi:MAG: hypothetical protein JWR24_5314 [Actinoallomurus sp.]|jgi:hypothetical protein|nr:hypothetical protein [Actinoallomurus sp.]